MNNVAERLAASGGACLASSGCGRRRAFWRNVVRQFNFPREEERVLLISLTDGVDWMRMPALPETFVARHREVYHLIATGEYQRSGAIMRDVTRTFSIFERGAQDKLDLAAQHGALLRVLNAIAEAEDGYCQGMNFIAALFLVEGLDEADAYALFLYLLRKRHFARIFHRSSSFLDEYLHEFEQLFRRTLPDLSDHMHAQGFAIPMFGIEWFTTLFSLSTKLELASAVFDMFFVGVQDIFLRTGLAILKLLEAKLMCMTSEDFLREFKTWVRQLDPYQVVLQALEFEPNKAYGDEDTAAAISRNLCLRSASSSLLSLSNNDSAGSTPSPPRSFDLHRTLPPDIADSIRMGNFETVRKLWEQFVRRQPRLEHCQVLANELLHYAIWFGRASIACFAIECCGADVDNTDDAELTPLHFSVVRNEPDMVRLLLAYGADDSRLGGLWSGRLEGLTPLDTARNWRFRDTTAARLVLEEEVCLCCNNRFDRLTFESETCVRCRFKYCCRPHSPCINTHQCPSEFWRRRGTTKRRTLVSKTLSTILEDCGHVMEPNQTEQAIESNLRRFDDDEVNESDGRLPRSFSGASASSMTRTTSESSSIVFVSSPSTAESLQTPQSSSASPRGKDHPLRLSEWLRNLSLSSPSQSSSESDSGRHPHPPSVPVVVLGLQFPDRPLWYCNARGCHAVFAFFTHALECGTCGGFFCSGDVDAKTKRCLSCLERN